MDRVVIIGCSAGGKSTVARRLGEILGIETIHLDKLLWKPGCNLTPPEEEPREVAKVLDQPRWIIDGNYTVSLPMRLKRADTVVIIDYSRTLCLFRALKRVWQHFGKTRPDMGSQCPEQINLQFLKWIWDYPTSERPELLRQLQEHGAHARVVHLRSPRETEKWLAELNQESPASESKELVSTH